MALCKHAEAVIQVFPNPVLDALNIEFLEKEQQEIRCQLINTSGVVVQATVWKKANKLHQINTQALPSGAYYLWIEIEGQAPMIQKVFKTRD